MLIHVDAHTRSPRRIEGEAHIVIAVRADGSTLLQSFCRGRLDASYAELTDEALQPEVGRLLNELRAQCAPASGG